MKIVKLIALVIVGALALNFIVNGFHNPLAPNIKYIDGKPYEVIKHEIDTIDIVKTNTITKQGKDIYHDTTIFVSVPTIVDTNQILMNYFAKNVYRDTLHLPDSLGEVVLLDTISKNSIESRKFTASVKQRTIKETTIVKELPKTKIFWGIGMGFDKTNFIHHVGANLLINTKCDKLYNIGGGVDINKTPFLNASIYWKIK
jgi:hypothetical protein